MSGAKVSLVAARLSITGNQAAIATAIGGGVVAADVASLAAMMTTLSGATGPSMYELIGLATTPANATTMLDPS